MPTVPVPAHALPFGGGGRSQRVLWVACAVVVVIGIAAQVLRPVAPALGPLPDPSRWFDAAHLARVAAYWGPRYALGLVALVVSVAVPLLVAATPQGQRLVSALLARVSARRPVTGAAVVAAAILIGTDLVLLPISFWTGFVHEGAYGFRVQGLGGWVRDWLLLRLPGWITVAVLVVGGMRLARALPRTWPLVAGLVGAVLTVIAVAAAPFVLEPVRFSTTPLGPGALREQITALVERSGIPADTVLVADASRRTTRHNAYISGLGGSRRVVLYDTLIADRPVEEVTMVVAHELGHERNADLWRGTLLGAAGAIVAALAIGLLIRRRMRSGRQAEATDPRGIAAIVALVVALSAVSLPLEQLVSRRAEAAADLAALELTGDAETFTAKTRELALQNLSDPQPPWWARTLWSSHPSPTERLTMGERWPFE